MDNSEQDKGANHDSYCNLDECQNHYVGWKKPDIKEYCRFSPIKNFIKKQFYSDKTHTHTHTHTHTQKNNGCLRPKSDEEMDAKGNRESSGQNGNV